MKGKYFKLKFIVCIFLSFIVIGGVGSFYLVSSMEEKFNSKVESESKLTSLEILKTDKEIKSIDLQEYHGKVIEISKSDDNLNHILIKTKPKYIQTSVIFDKEFSDKVKVFSKNIFTNKLYKPFSKFEEVFDNSLVSGEIINFFGKRNSIKNKEKIILKLKNPVEILFNKNLSKDKENFDYSLIKNELDFNLYKNILTGNGLIYEINKNDLFNTDEFKIKNFSDEVLNIGKFSFKNMKVETSKIKNLTIDSLGGIYHNNNDDDLITIDCKNVEKMVKINLENLSSNINIVNAKSVILNKLPLHAEVLINYKINDEIKSLKILSKFKNKKTLERVITIDSKEIFRAKSKGEENDLKHLDKIK